MTVWEHKLKKGKWALKQHEPKCALPYLQQALKHCPVKESVYLEKILFYMGITLIQLGQNEPGKKTWDLAQRVRKNGFSSKMLKRFINSYGNSYGKVTPYAVAERPNREKEDKKAFFAIQLARYLNMKKSGTLGTEAEKDMVTELISEHWDILTQTLDLQTKTKNEKYRIFMEYEIIFPFLMIPQEGQNKKNNGNLGKDFVFKTEKLCLCGSGLPFSACCGRSFELKRILSGNF